MQGTPHVRDETADAGGWLAAYVHTKLFVQTQQARSTIVLRDITNAMHMSLHKAMDNTGDDAHLTEINAVAVGAVLEHLC